MYFARFDSEGREWLQAAAALSGQWSWVARQLAGAALIPESTVARRIILDDDRRIRQVIALTVPASRELQLRQALGQLMRLERMNGAVIQAAQSAEEHDQLMKPVGSRALCPTAAPFVVGGVPIACNFRLIDLLDELLIDAALNERALTYQVHIRAATIPPAWLREARRNVLALQELPGVQPSLLAWQDQLARALNTACALREEFLCVDSADAAESIAARVTDRFRQDFGQFGFGSPGFQFEPETHADGLRLGIHSHDLGQGRGVVVSSIAESASERDRILCWSPSSQLDAVLPTETEEHLVDDGAPALPGRGRDLFPPLCSDDGPFVFISYKRTDAERVAPVVRLIAESGTQIWYDRGIPGGAEWDEVIEDRVEKAQGLVMLATSASIESKYVRREVKFADAMNVPVLPIFLEACTPAHGLKMLFSQYQMLDAAAADFAAQLRTALAMLGSAFTGRQRSTRN